MPIILNNEQSQAERLEAPLQYSTTVDTGDVVRSFIDQEVGLIKAPVSKLNDVVFRKFEADPEYDKYDDIAGYEGYADRLLDSDPKSSQEMAYLKSKIDDEVKDYETFAAGTGWQKAAAIGTTMVVDPLNMIPVGATAYKTYRTGGKILNGATKTAGVAAATETANEALIQYNSMTREVDDSLSNIAVATFIGGLLGGAATAVSEVNFKSLIDRADQELTVPVDLSSSTAGAQQATTTSAQEEIKGLNRTIAFFEKVPSFLKNPVFENAVSKSKVVREISEKLGDLSLVKNKNTDFIESTPSVEARIKAYQTLEVPVYEAYKNLYKSYKARAKEGLPLNEQLGSGKNGVLTEKEFYEQAGRAGRNNDSHVIKEVAEVAKVSRKHLFDPVLKQAGDVKIFDNIDEIDVQTAPSWMRRMYDIDKIQNQRTEFKKIVLDDLKEQRLRAIDEYEQIKLEEGITDADFIEYDNIQYELNQYRKENFGKLQDPQVKARIKAYEDSLTSISKYIPDDVTLKKLVKLKIKTTQLDEELSDISEQLIDRITNSTGGRLPYDNVIEPRYKGNKIGARGSAKARVWGIKDEKIEGFLINDIRAIGQSYLRTMAPDIEIKRMFGTLDIDPIKKQIQEDYNRIISSKVKDKKTGKMRPKTNKEMADLKKRQLRDIKNIEAMHEKLRGVFAQPDDYSAPQHVIERTAMGLNFVRLLGDVVMSSLPDIMRPIMVHGVSRTYGKLFSSLIKDIEGLKLSINEMKEMGLILDIVKSITAMKRMNMDEYIPTGNKIDESMKSLQSFAGLAFGVNHWNAIMKAFSGIMTQNRMMDAILDYSKTGKLGRKEIENLASHGIGKDMAKRIADQFKKHGETRKVLKIANARNWDDVDARNTFRMAIRKQVDEIIVTPSLDKPLWMSRAGWKTVGQFKSFSFSSTQRVLLAGIQQADSNILVGTTASIMVGSLVYAYKQKMAGRPVSDDPRVWIAEGVDRSGISGYFMDVNNIVEKVTRGTVGVNALTGGGQMSRYASRNVTGALLGASYGLAQDMFQVVGSASTGEWTQSDTHAVRKIAPFQNAPYLRGLYDQLEAGVNGTFGVE